MSSQKKKETSRKDLPDVSRKVPESIRLQLVAAAGGRCEFLGCKTTLFVHPVTKGGGYFGNYAHIRAFSPSGPRAGTEAERENIDLNALENLLLLCPACHHLVDTEERHYPIEKLRKWKTEHEERIVFLLDLPDENETAIMEIWTDVSAPPVVRTPGQMVAALLPLYPSRKHNYVVDLAGHNLEDVALLPAAVGCIDEQVQRLFSKAGERPQHLGVFGITNIPLLVYLGARLGDRIQAHLFQYHRDTKSWRWKDEPSTAEFKTILIRKGSDRKRVALLLSLSGQIDYSKLPVEIDDSYTVYEIRLNNETPNPAFLRTKEDLAKFREAYRSFLAQLQVDHGMLDDVAVIPAVPIPIAISLGMDRLPKIAPTLAVYDIDKNSPATKSYKRMLNVR